MKRLALLALLLAACGGAGSSAPAAAQTLVSLSGSGTKNSGPFDAPGQWTIDWSFDCSSNGAPGTFYVSVGDETHSDITPPPVQPPMSLKASGSDFVYKSGHLHLGVTADDGCAWSVTAKG